MRIILIVAEILWLLYFVAFNIVMFALTDTSLLARAARQDIFNLGTHISILLATIHGKCAPWLAVLYLFELYRDVMNGINISLFSPLSFTPQYHEMWIAALVLVWYQAIASLVGLVVCLLNIKSGNDVPTRKTIRIKTQF